MTKVFLNMDTVKDVIKEWVLYRFVEGLIESGIQEGQLKGLFERLYIDEERGVIWAGDERGVVKGDGSERWLVYLDSTDVGPFMRDIEPLPLGLIPIWGIKGVLRVRKVEEGVYWYRAQILEGMEGEGRVSSALERVYYKTGKRVDGWSMNEDWRRVVGLEYVVDDFLTIAGKEAGLGDERKGYIGRALEYVKGGRGELRKLIAMVLQGRGKEAMRMVRGMQGAQVLKRGKWDGRDNKKLTEFLYTYLNLK